MKKTLFISFMLTLFCTVMGILTATAQINSNGGFESWTDNTPNGWMGSKTNISASNVFQVTDAHTGNYACMLKTTTSHKRFTLQPMSLYAEQQYTITYWVKGYGRIRTSIYDDNYNTYNEYHLVNSQSYIQFVDTVTSDVDVTNGEFIFSVLNYMDSTETTDSLIIDDVQIDFYPPVEAGVVSTPNIIVSGTLNGNDYVNTASVSISTITDSTTIYYTTDGSTPTTSATIYTAPFDVTSSCTIKAFATRSGYTDSEVATEYISIQSITVLLSEDFESSGLGQMSQYSAAGDSKVWDQGNYSGNHYAYLNAYNAGVNEDWLLTPQLTPISQGVTLSFRTATKYNGAPLQLKYSSDYTGSGDPEAATWTDITDSAAWSTGNYTWVHSGDVNINESNPLYIAFVYTSTETAAAAWEVDDILVTSTNAPQVVPTLSILSPASGASFSTLDTLAIDIDIENFTLGTDGLLKIESDLLTVAGVPNPAYFDAITWAVFENMAFSPLPAGSFTATATLVGLDSLPLATPVSATTTFTVTAPTLPTPVITVTGTEAEAADTYYFTANVAIAAENGAEIRYTLDGTTPDANATLYTAPFDVTTSCTVQAISMKANYTNSAVASATIVIDTPTVAAPVFTPASGVFTDSVQVTITCSDETATIRYTTDGTEPTETSTLYATPIVVTATTTLKAKAFKADWHASDVVEATYTIVNEAILTATPTTLSFNSNTLTNNITVSAAFINNPIVLTCNDTHFSLSHDTLTNGNSTVTVTFDGTEPATGIITITGDTLSVQIALTATVTLPTPTFTPASGTSDTLIEVAIACANANAAVYYTTDGTTPDTNATLYSAPFELSTVGDHTVKTIAILNGWDNSEVATATYNIYRMTVETPVITPATGTSDTLIAVSIACATPNAVIYYTTDGTTPDTAATVYSAPFELNVPGTYTVNAIAMKANWNNSEMASATYTVTAPVPPTPQFNDTLAYYTGFEPSEGFTPGTTYNNTTENLDGPDGYQWGTYYGTVSYNSVICDSSSMQMRWYTSSPSAIGYTRANFDIAHATRIQFKAKANRDANVMVSYSTDGGNTYTDSVFSLLSTPRTYNWVISETAEFNSVRFKFSISLPEDEPTGRVDLVIDSVSIYNFPSVVSDVVEMPVISPNAGNVIEPTQVSITCPTEGASIYYTLDGTEPTESATLYTAPFTITATTTVKAKAYKTGYEASNVASAIYTFPTEVANIAAFKAANTETNSTLYKITGDVTFVFKSERNIYIQDATGGLLLYDNQNIVTNSYTEGDVISGGIYGTYTLYNGLVEMVPSVNPATASSNTGTVSPVITTVNDIITNYTQFESRLVKLQGVTFTEAATFNTGTASNAYIEQNDETMQVRSVFKTLNLTVEAGDIADITGFVLRYNSNYQIAPRNNNDIVINTVVMDTVAAPIITVNPLTNNMVSVVITSATEDATIYYTLDGTTPTESSTLYDNSFIHQDEAFTVKAIAVKEGMANSDVTTYNYTPVGVNTYEVNITLYPNPTADQCHIVSDNSVIRDLSVFDIYGKTIRQMTVNDNSTVLEMGELPSGTYFVRIVSDKGTTVKKVVRQ